MSYKYRNGSTPEHVNSDDSNSIPTPKIAPRDATATNKPDPVMDKLVAKDKDSTTRYNRATKAQYGETDESPGLARMNVNFNRNLGYTEDVQPLKNIVPVADKALANRAALDAYKKNKQ